MKESFIKNMQPAPVGGGFEMDNYWIWCGSVIQGEDGKYHMFASRWSMEVSFWPYWVTNSEIVRAVSDTPEGPFEFAEVILPSRGPDFWDGMMTHNPTIHKSGDTYLLYYTGTTYSGGMPDVHSQDIWGNEKTAEARRNQRVGLAVSHSITGPWERFDEPILQPRTGKWDGLMTTNPAACVLPDGSVMLVYKSTGDQLDRLRLGIAKADHYRGPYVRLREEPIFQFDEMGDHVEDPYIWFHDGRFQLIMKDMEGGICGEMHAGIHATSSDGVHWEVSNPPMAYSRRVQWDDHTETVQGSLERPQLLIQDGIPTHFYAATANCGGVYDLDNPATKTWTIAIPLMQSHDSLDTSSSNLPLSKGGES
ncbi:glycoside hydrolase family protein [Paenibacillus foliorum]|uniref:glycoside hydrolase family protein n=1 Tax=Paenibacillus foliorum TaxID=2654974 RepID=UPI001C0F6BF2|nr:glycoside hydrolase family protein [Paenibacillus foliorum]